MSAHAHRVAVTALLLLAASCKTPDLPFGDADRAAILLAFGEPTLAFDQDTVLVHYVVQGGADPRLLTHDSVYVQERGVWIRRGLRLGYQVNVRDPITVHEFDRNGRLVK
jgi:hypothetical protein